MSAQKTSRADKLAKDLDMLGNIVMQQDQALRWIVAEIKKLNGDAEAEAKVEATDDNELIT